MDSLEEKVRKESGYLSDQLQDESDLKKILVNLADINRENIKTYIDDIRNGRETDEGECLSVYSDIEKGSDLANRFRSYGLQLSSSQELSEDINRLKGQCLDILPTVTKRAYKNFKTQYAEYKNSGDIDARRRAKKHAEEFLYLSEVADHYDISAGTSKRKVRKATDAINRIDTLRIEEDRTKDQLIEQYRKDNEDIRSQKDDELERITGELEANKTTYQQQIQSLKGMLEKERSKKEEVVEKNQQYDRRVQLLESQIEETESEGKRLIQEARNEGYEDAAKRITSQYYHMIAGYKEQLDGLKEQIRETKETYQQKIDSLETVLHDSKRKISEKEREKEKQTAQKDQEYAEEIQRLMDILNSKEETIESYTQRIQALEEEKGKIDQKREMSEKDRESAIKRCQELQDLYNSTITQLEREKKNPQESSTKGPEERFVAARDKGFNLSSYIKQAPEPDTYRLFKVKDILEGRTQVRDHYQRISHAADTLHQFRSLGDCDRQFIGYMLKGIQKEVQEGKTADLINRSRYRRELVEDAIETFRQYV